MRRLGSCSKGCLVCELMLRCLLRLGVFFFETACLVRFLVFAINLLTLPDGCRHRAKAPRPERANAVGYLAKNDPVGGLSCIRPLPYFLFHLRMSIGTLSRDAVRQRETEKLSRHFLLDRRLADDCPADWLLNRIRDLTPQLLHARNTIPPIIPVHGTAAGNSCDRLSSLVTYEVSKNRHHPC